MSGYNVKTLVSNNVTITPTKAAGSAVDIKPLNNITMHIVLAVTDRRDMGATTYRRVILNPVA